MKEASSINVHTTPTTNVRRLLWGSLAAWIVIMLSGATMIPVVGNEMDTALARLGLPTLSLGAMVFFSFVSLVNGCTLVCLGAGLLPALRNKWNAALVSALVVSIIGYVLPIFAKVAYGFLPMKLCVIGAVWGILEATSGSLVGMFVYRR